VENQRSLKLGDWNSEPLSVWMPSTLNGNRSRAFSTMQGKRLSVTQDSTTYGEIGSDFDRTQVFKSDRS